MIARLDDDDVARSNKSRLFLAKNSADVNLTQPLDKSRLDCRARLKVALTSASRGLKSLDLSGRAQG